MTNGLAKINIRTALNVSFTGAVPQALSDDQKAVDPRKYLHPARAALAVTVQHVLKCSLTASIP